MPEFVNVHVIVDVVVDCWRCQPALAERSRGTTRFSLSKYVQMSRCQNSLTSTSTSTSTAYDGHPSVPKMFNLFLECSFTRRVDRNRSQARPAWGLCRRHRAAQAEGTVPRR